MRKQPPHDEATGEPAAPVASLDLDDPSLFINRELSQLEFNARVLEQARDPTVPLLERLRFLTICGTNLDEFFEVRVSGLKQQVAFGISSTGKPDGMAPDDVLAALSDRAHRLVDEQYRVLNEEILPALEDEGVRLFGRASWSAKLEKWVKRFFKAQVQPVLTPIGLDPAHPFPRVLNKALNFVVSLSGPDAFGRSADIAVVQVPRSLPRVIRLPASVAGGRNDFVTLSSVIHAHLAEIFPGMEVTGCHQFRITRNSDLWVDEEEVENLLIALKGELPSRNYGAAVRLEVGRDCPDKIIEFLLRSMDLGIDDLYRVDGPVNLHRLVSLLDEVARPDLKYDAFAPSLPRRLTKERDLFEVLRGGDVLLHHPYQSFLPVVELLRQAAEDPAVLAIKQTLYRTDTDSAIIEHLIDAARRGKEVTVLVELRARFDEARNIGLATQLEEAGVNVLYGIVGFKAHAKLLMIVRREGRRLRRYVHMGTGNYHTTTARAYTDFGFLTADREIAEDVDRVWTLLTGLGKVRKLKHLLHSPFTLHKTLLRLIQDEITAAQAGRPARILVKLNALSEKRIIQALYRASQAGVEVDLIVRGICCLRPGVAGVSENIRVRSVIGRFLEHARVYHFHAGGAELTFCGSADWMSRNLLRRVETCFPITEPRLAARVKRESFDLALEDNCQSWLLTSDGSYECARSRAGARRRSVQETLLDELSGD